MYVDGILPVRENRFASSHDSCCLSLYHYGHMGYIYFATTIAYRFNVSSYFIFCFLLLSRCSCICFLPRRRQRQWTPIEIPTDTMYNNGKMLSIPFILSLVSFDVYLFLLFFFRIFFCHTHLLFGFVCMNVCFPCSKKYGKFFLSSILCCYSLTCTPFDICVCVCVFSPA